MPEPWEAALAYVTDKLAMLLAEAPCIIVSDTPRTFKWLYSVESEALAGALVEAFLEMLETLAELGEAAIESLETLLSVIEVAEAEAA